MSVQALLLVLAAAVLHAGWNFIVKTSDDRLVAAWAVATAAALVNVPVLVFLGLPERSAAGWLALSSVLHVAYGFALAGAYDRVDLAAAYPIARGTAPLIVAVISVPLLGDSINLVGMIGIVLVSSSLAIIGLRHVPSGVAWPVLTGVVIAAYTLSDGAGVRAGDESVRYIAAMFVLHSVLFTVTLGFTRRSTITMREAVTRQTGRLLIGGASSAGAYLLVMIAARTTPLGLVAGLRETSAGIGVIAGYTLLGERVTPKHAAAVVVAIVGAVTIAIS